MCTTVPKIPQVISGIFNRFQQLREKNNILECVKLKYFFSFATMNSQSCPIPSRRISVAVACLIHMWFCEPAAESLVDHRVGTRFLRNTECLSGKCVRQSLDLEGHQKREMYPCWFEVPLGQWPNQSRQQLAPKSCPFPVKFQQPTSPVLSRVDALQPSGHHSVLVVWKLFKASRP